MHATGTFYQIIKSIHPFSYYPDREVEYSQYYRCFPCVFSTYYALPNT